MAFREVADLDCSETVAIGGKNKETGKPNPKSIEGYFIGTKKTETKLGECSLHILQTQKGNVGVWGKTNLNQKMTAVKPGQMIRISFVGLVETKFNPMFKYKVEVDPENTIDVASASGNDAPEDFEAEEGESFNSDHSYQTDDEEEASFDDDTAADEAEYVPPTPPHKAAAVPDASRQDKVKALLAGRKSSRA